MNGKGTTDRRSFIHAGQAIRHLAALESPGNISYTAEVIPETMAKIRSIAKRLRTLTILILILAIGGCASMGGSESSAGMAFDPEPAPEPAMVSTSSDAPAPRGRADGLALVAAADGESDQSPKEPNAGKRLRVYSAEMTMSVASIDESRRALLSLVDELGGYVESSQGDYVVLRVPAQSFDRAVESISALGIVIGRSIRAADVTDQYADIANRLRIAEAARTRLDELLTRTDDSKEQVKILREIRRLTEEIEQLRGEIASLEEMIAFSRIAVSLVPRRQVDRIARGEIPFDWIRRLDPLVTSTSESRSSIAIEIDDDFAQFATGKFVRAESADGVLLRIGAVLNSPRGGADFWQRALSFHLRLLYRSIEPFGAGEFTGVVLESKGASPFFYLVLVSPRDDELIVAEAFFPNQVAFDRRFDRVASLLGGAIR